MKPGSWRYTPRTYHPPLDNAVESLDTEDIPFGCSHFTEDLLDDMRCRPTSYLELHYPELTFGSSKGAGRPKGHDFAVYCRGGYRFADWRKV